jgi:hypothetical protein
MLSLRPLIRAINRVFDAGLALGWRSPSLPLSLTVATLTFPAFADDTTAVGVGSQIIPMLIAAVPGILLGLWALFKAHAAQSEASWDDEAVAFVEKIAQGVVDKKLPAAK